LTIITRLCAFAIKHSLTLIPSFFPLLALLHLCYQTLTFYSLLPYLTLPGVGESRGIAVLSQLPTSVVTALTATSLQSDVVTALAVPPASVTVLSFFTADQFLTDAAPLATANSTLAATGVGGVAPDRKSTVYFTFKNGGGRDASGQCRQLYNQVRLAVRMHARFSTL
jgi:hypothetical protein